MDIKNVISKLSKNDADKFLECSKYGVENTFTDEGTILKIIEILLPYVDDKEILDSYDYLRCQREHKRQVERLSHDTQQYSHPLRELFEEFGGDFRHLSQRLIENIRYGKRDERLDELLTKISLLEKVLSASRPNLSISTESPSRCNQCNRDCLASFRILTTTISSIYFQLRMETVSKTLNKSQNKSE